MKVYDVMEHAVVSIQVDTSYEDAASIMSKHNFSGLPVVDDKGHLVGVISEKDLFRAIYPAYEEYSSNPENYLDQEALEGEIESLRKRPVSDFMSRSVLTVESDTPIMAAGGIMLARGVHRLPVMSNGRMIGIVTREHIYGAILKQHLG